MIDNNQLINQIKSYNRFLNADTVNKAYHFALEAHQNQKREEGVPYIIHPVLKKNLKFLINKLDLKSRLEITRLNKNVNIKI